MTFLSLSGSYYLSIEPLLKSSTLLSDPTLIEMGTCLIDYYLIILEISLLLS